MDFARQQLFKFGWTEGKGLGKNEDGISEALKPKLKFDTAGVGHDISEQFTFNWWENVYNNAADNINIKKSVKGEVSIELNSEDSVDITTKKYSLKHLKKKNKYLEYGSFMKTSKLTAEGIVDHEDKIISAEDRSQIFKRVNLTDEELFAACGGRTAHKGARHGLKASGKLARLGQQEKMLLEQYYKEKKKPKKIDTLKMCENEVDENVLKECKKKEHRSKAIAEKVKEEVLNNGDNNNETRKKKKKRKRNHSHSEHENFLEEETANKRYEYHYNKQHRKKLQIKRKKEEKAFSKISDMLENCNLENPPVDNSEDDGFDENINKKKIKLMDDDDAARKEAKRLKKKKKKQREQTEENSEDGGFVDLMNEITDKLVRSKEIRKKLRHEKKKLDDQRISRISEELGRVCKV